MLKHKKQKKGKLRFKIDGARRALGKWMLKKWVKYQEYMHHDEKDEDRHQRINRLLDPPKVQYNQDQYPADRNNNLVGLQRWIEETENGIGAAGYRHGNG